MPIFSSADRPLKVLTFLHSFELGGVERVALRLVRAWRALGIAAPLLMGRENGPLRAEIATGLAYDAPRPPLWGSHWFETIWMMRHLPAYVRQEQPDIVFCAGNTYSVVAVWLRLRLGRACPPIMAKISNDLDRADMASMFRMAYRLWLRVQGRAIARFVASDGAMARALGSQLGIARRQIELIANPGLTIEQIDALRAQPRVVGNGRGRRFVAIGRLVPQKNYPMMLRAFARGSVPEDSLTIYGDGSDEGQLRGLMSKLGLDGRIKLAGHVSNPDKLLHQYDILLLSSRYEGLPSAVLEALAANLPVIATDCGVSMPGLLRHGRLGKLVAPDDEAGFAEAIHLVQPNTQDPIASLEQARCHTIEAASMAYARSFAALAPSARTAVSGSGLHHHFHSQSGLSGK